MGSNNPENSNAIAGALTYPNRSDGNMQRIPVQPRQPTNLQGLLRFAMEATKIEDASGTSNFGPMAEERRRFLEEALRSLTVDMGQVIQNAIKVLTDTEKMRGIQIGQPLPDDVETAFNNLLDFVDDIDIANDFYKMGGFAIFPVCYGCESAEVRARASGVLAELCQNNAYCQARALECGLFNVLLNLAQSERGHALAKCLYAISCMTREYQPACRELTAQGGCETLVQLISSPEPAPRIKAAFLVRYLCEQYPSARAQFIHLNLVRTVAEQIKTGRDETSEHLLSILLALVDGQDYTVLSQCRDPTLGLKNILENHLKHPDLVDDRFREEKEYCRELLSQIFENYTQEVHEEVADR